MTSQSMTTNHSLSQNVDSGVFYPWKYGTEHFKTAFSRRGPDYKANILYNLADRVARLVLGAMEWFLFPLNYLIAAADRRYLYTRKTVSDKTALPTPVSTPKTAHAMGISSPTLTIIDKTAAPKNLALVLVKQPQTPQVIQVSTPVTKPTDTGAAVNDKANTSWTSFLHRNDKTLLKVAAFLTLGLATAGLIYWYKSSQPTSLDAHDVKSMDRINTGTNANSGTFGDAATNLLGNVASGVAEHFVKQTDIEPQSTYIPFQNIPVIHESATSAISQPAQAQQSESLHDVISGRVISALSNLNTHIVGGVTALAAVVVLTAVAARKCLKTSYDAKSSTSTNPSETELKTETEIPKTVSIDKQSQPQTPSQAHSKAADAEDIAQIEQETKLQTDGNPIMGAYGNTLKGKNVLTFSVEKVQKEEALRLLAQASSLAGPEAFELLEIAALNSREAAAEGARRYHQKACKKNTTFKDRVTYHQHAMRLINLACQGLDPMRPDLSSFEKECLENKERYGEFDPKAESKPVPKGSSYYSDMKPKKKKKKKTGENAKTPAEGDSRSSQAVRQVPALSPDQLQRKYQELLKAANASDFSAIGQLFDIYANNQWQQYNPIFGEGVAKEGSRICVVEEALKWAEKLRPNAGLYEKVEPQVKLLTVLHEAMRCERGDKDTKDLMIGVPTHPFTQCLNSVNFSKCFEMLLYLVDCHSDVNRLSKTFGLGHHYGVETRLEALKDYTTRLISLAGKLEIPLDPGYKVLATEVTRCMDYWKDKGVVSAALNEAISAQQKNGTFKTGLNEKALDALNQTMEREGYEDAQAAHAISVHLSKKTGPKKLESGYLKQAMEWLNKALEWNKKDMAHTMGYNNELENQAKEYQELHAQFSKRYAELNSATNA